MDANKPSLSRKKTLYYHCSVKETYVDSNLFRDALSLLGLTSISLWGSSPSGGGENGTIQEREVAAGQTSHTTQKTHSW